MVDSKWKVFEVNDRSTYSNAAFALLGIVLERATGKKYAEIISSSILEPLGMNHTVTTKPKDSMGVIPSGPNDWAQDLDAEIPFVSVMPYNFMLPLTSRSDLEGCTLQPTTCPNISGPFCRRSYFLSLSLMRG
jgi:hypothetical protein